MEQTLSNGSLLKIEDRKLLLQINNEYKLLKNYIN